MKIGVKVMPRNELLDSQGRAVLETLKRHGQTLNECRVGRYIELEFKNMSSEKALQKAQEISDFVLHNPLIETYELQVIGDSE